ncbi:alpha,alpha-phosphotrehalase [Enorma phocaeensis]|uniref:Alpha,alpha-phosphotrehalase n=1 Tax=Enorma phocaeensis TaxID=1871019 RepID=A0ABT7V759_9ACTN|nr:alpha,alpha-phosphotrehalase [Enorma phocaeensis]MDM8274323.1 alpha,alpha-phosphotrehalase [Enorma phocaeensis]
MSKTMSKHDLGSSVVYQIYIKSFCDSDGDGIGDLPGIVSKLDYLKYLGVDYIWITPFFPSPQRDNGYDVSDYCAIDPAYGTMDDFDALVAEARRRGMGIMLDMVLCHTSSEHEWFQRALAGEERYRRYYILRDGRGSSGPGDPGEPPTNWQCAFGGSAWEWEPRLGKWYLHMHDVSQPDLDWTNPEVREACADVVRFWRDRGVRGFRFDVVNLISKPEVIEDVPGSGSACRALVADGPHVHEYLQELVERAGIDGMITVGEMAATNLENCVRYTNPASHELSMTFSFHHLKVDYKDGKKWELADPDIARLRQIFSDWQEGMQAGEGWNALFWNNHDQPRAISRFGGRGGAGYPDTSWEKVGKMLATCTHFMQGTPYIFQGEELGMTNPGYPSIDDYRDVESKNYYRIMIEGGKSPAEALRVVSERSRDDGRTPMQWSAAAHAGFTTGEPWIGVAPNYERVNAEAEAGVEGSMLEFYRRLVCLRKELDVVAEGAVRFVDAGPAAPKVIAYERVLEDAPAGQPKRLLVLCSFDNEPCAVRLSGAAAEGLGDAGVLLGTYPRRLIDPASGMVALHAFEALVLAW